MSYAALNATLKCTASGACAGQHGALDHNDCMINNIIVSGEAILSYENGGTPLGGRGSAPNPAVGAHSVSPYPLAGGEGLVVPPQEPYPAFGLRKFGLELRPFVLPPMKNLGHAFVQQLYRMIGAYVYMKNAVATVTQDLHEVFYPTPRDGQHSLFF